VQVEFAIGDTEADALLRQVETAGIDVFYVRMPIEFGTLGGAR
jgi:hypothetical protein